MQEKKLYIIALIGALICFTGDILLGFFTPAPDFMNKYVVGIIYVGVLGMKNHVGFWKLAARYIVMLYVMKAFDIVVQDQWLVMTVGYFKKIFPETSECKGWKDRGFNNKNQIIRIVLYPFLAMITAGIFVLICK